MKLSDAREAYEGLSAKASEIVRQLALAGIGVAWVFRSTSNGIDHLDPKLIRACFFVVIALGLDLLQYLVSTTIWLLYFRHKEKKHTRPDTEFKAPKQLNWPNFFFFYVKSIALFIGYAHYIVPYLWWKFVG